MALVVVCACGHPAEEHSLEIVEVVRHPKGNQIQWKMKCKGRDGNCKCKDFR